MIHQQTAEISLKYTQLKSDFHGVILLCTMLVTSIVQSIFNAKIKVKCSMELDNAL